MRLRWEWPEYMLEKLGFRRRAFLITGAAGPFSWNPRPGSAYRSRREKFSRSHTVVSHTVVSQTMAFHARVSYAMAFHVMASHPLFSLA